MLTLPNLVSFLRLLLVPTMLWLLFGRDNAAAAGWLLGIIGGTDWIDGYLARRLDQVSEIGKFLDPLADRLAVFAGVVGGWIAGVLAPWFAVALIAREVAVGVGALFVGLAAGSKLEVRYLGKLATALLYAAIAFFYIGAGTPFDPLTWTAWVIAVPGLAVYYLVGVQYVGDARAAVAAQRDGGPE